MSTQSPVRFSCFEVDLKGREVRKRGIKIKLQDQPFEVLAALLERPGQLVTGNNSRPGSGPATPSSTLIAG
jgi:DNA-binding response OmpR family regulator